MLLSLVFSVLKREVRANKLVKEDGKRLDIRMVNSAQEQKYGYLLLELCAGSSLTAYSLPLSLDEEACSDLAIESIKLLCPHNAPRTFHRNEDSIYCAYVNGRELVRTLKVIRWQRQKYRGGAKFSNAFKATNVTVSEKVLD